MESHSKVCSKCGKEKSRTEFYKDSRKKGGLLSPCKACKKQYYQENREQKLEYQKQYDQGNREQRLEYKRQHRQRNRGQILEYKKQYYQENREKILEYFKNYRQENPEKISAGSAKRRALELDNIPDVISNCPKEKERLVQIYKLRNLFTKTTGIEYHVDHIWPLSKGGPHWAGNLQIITAEENLSKGDKLCEETVRVIQESLDEHCSHRQ